MPRPGRLTRSRANRLVKTPSGRLVTHRQKYYRSDGVCAVSGAKLKLPRKARQGKNKHASHSSKRPNRPYGGVVTSRATQRGIIRRVRELDE